MIEIGDYVIVIRKGRRQFGIVIERGCTRIKVRYPEGGWDTYKADKVRKAWECHVMEETE